MKCDFYWVLLLASLVTLVFAVNGHADLQNIQTVTIADLTLAYIES